VCSSDLGKTRLSQELWEFAAALPFEVRLRGGSLKAVLRELARRRLGARVADAPKRGFTIPVQRWVAAHWLPKFDALLNDSILESEGWIRSAAVSEALQNARQKQWAANQLWYIFVLESWLRREREAQTDLTLPSLESQEVFSVQPQCSL